MKKRHFIILIVVLLFTGYCVSSLGAALTPYVTIAEAKVKTGNLQVKGVLDASAPAPISRDGKFYFAIKDEAGDSVDVVYNGRKPDSFDEAVHIVVVGRYQDGRLVSDKLLIKCPSKYEKFKEER